MERRTNNSLSRQQHRKLEDFILEKIAEFHAEELTAGQIAERAAKLLGFSVTEGNVSSSLNVLGLKTNSRWAGRGTRAPELRADIDGLQRQVDQQAKQIVELSKLLFDSVTFLADRTGRALPNVLRERILLQASAPVAEALAGNGTH